MLIDVLVFFIVKMVRRGLRVGGKSNLAKKYVFTKARRAALKRAQAANRKKHPKRKKRR